MKKIVTISIIFIITMITSSVIAMASDSKYEFKYLSSKYSYTDKSFQNINNKAVAEKKEIIPEHYLQLMNKICSYQYVFLEREYAKNLEYFGDPPDSYIPATVTTDDFYHDIYLGNLDRVQFILIDPYSYSYKLKSLDSGQEVLCRDRNAKNINEFMDHISRFMKSFLADGNTQSKYGISDSDWELMKVGRIQIGFTRDMLFLSLGSPWDGSKEIHANGIYEVFIFKMGKKEYYMSLLNNRLVSVSS